MVSHLEMEARKWQRARDQVLGQGVCVQQLEETFTTSSQAMKLFMFPVSIFRLVSRGINSHYEYPLVGVSRKLFVQNQEFYVAKDWDECLHICEYLLPVSTRGRHWRLWMMAMV